MSNQESSAGRRSKVSTADLRATRTLTGEERSCPSSPSTVWSGSSPTSPQTVPSSGHRVFRCESITTVKNPGFRDAESLGRSPRTDA